MPTATPRDDVRERIIASAAALLRDKGSAAVTTRAVAERAGIQAPTIYRLFGDKEGLLDAVAEWTMATFGAAKVADLARPATGDPVDDLRHGWDETVRFGLEHPDLFVLLSDPRRGRDSPALATGVHALEERVRRVASRGRLRVSEERAVALIHAAGTGAILTLLEHPSDERDPAVADALFEAVLASIIVPEATGASAEPAHRTAAVTLRADAAELDALSNSERSLLVEWLDRVIRTP
ncbi:transcriptional regulator, TetR family [Microbacterium sp. ru370.1]|uniref:TetR/AcrR family transcriptional regulator n=1 Tax=unclassified Microbacterium TaxID=2609290 RepID=UPI0008876008|nr:MULTISPECIES: TetR/AcrR family transcriptional regulator [unclassified Microbacterium]SDO91257.1 transcriptional regulator, TetR family [Microbacterium sp. ru370.1]SIT93391.1 transcriptional regulator, TetR family [Microbacterium sp. RU1D]